MITIDCKDVLPIKQDLAVYVADEVGMIPSIHSKKFILSQVNEEDVIDESKVIDVIRKFFRDNHKGQKFDVVQENNSITITLVGGKPLTVKPKEEKQVFFECTHCGFLTRYQEDLRTHRYIHYI